MLLYSPYGALFHKPRNRVKNLFLASARSNVGDSANVKKTVCDRRSSINATELTTRQFCLSILFIYGVKYEQFTFCLELCEKYT